ncbi:MAG: InlB B-repeat-containing protein [Bacilli bacterium]|nr:InlB B-repeat-containing protein [Bacilli bacterium]
MGKLKERKYKILLALIAVLISAIIINRIGFLDMHKNEASIGKVLVNRINSLSANINDNIVNAYDEINYKIKFNLDSKEDLERTVKINVTLSDEESKYIKFKEINGNNISSKISENQKNLEITMMKVRTNEETKVNITLLVSGAPNNLKINPIVSIKEETQENQTKISTDALIVKTNSVQGKVLDSDGAKVSNIELSLKKENEEIKRTYTDENGNYIFSGLEEGLYNIGLEEKDYILESENKIEIKEGTSLNLVVRKVNPYNIETSKTISRLIIKNNGKEETYTYNDLEKVVQSIKELKEIEGEITYKITVTNTGEKEGIVEVVKDIIPSGLNFNKEKNEGWEENKGIVYNRELEGIKLRKNESKTVTLKLDIAKTKEAKNYINNVTAYGEVYNNISYVIDNKAYKEERVLEGDKLIKPIIEIEGFDGWYTDKNYTNKYNFNNIVTKDIILYGKINREKEKFNVTFIDDGKIIETKKVESGDKIGQISNPSKDGYTFIGWYEEDSENSFDFDKSIERDVTLYSKYEINKYNVTFINEGKEYDKQEVEYKSNINEITTPTKEYYTFKYWSLEKNGQKYDLTLPVTDNITLYAVYEINKYDVVFIDDNNEISKDNVEAGTILIAPKVGKQGYTFKHWSTSINGEGYDLTMPVTSNITLYSVYEINKYNIEFYDYENNIIKTLEKEYNKTLVLDEAPSVEEEGYTFTGWYELLSSTPYDFNSKITRDIKLYPKHEIIKNAVTFNDENKITKQEVNYGSNANEIESLGKEGYTFKYWSISINGEAFDFSTPITNVTTLYAVYEINKYRVTFINEGVEYNSQEINYNNQINTIENPSKEGYTFKYWSTSVYGDAYDLTTPVTNDITLYSVYEINKYKITFKNYDGSILQEETLEYGSTPAYKGETPVREKTQEYTYTFSEFTPNLQVVRENKEYVAQFTSTKNKYKITFANYDGSILQEEDLEYGSTPTYKGEAPIREKTQEYTYTFNGFTPQITNVTGVFTYIASYTSTKNKYIVTFMDGDNIYASIETEYGESVNRVTDPSKEHNIFREWKLNNEVYDFNSLVTDNITLYSSYELVEKPVVTRTPDGWVKDKVVVNIASNHADYSYKYKIDDGTYIDYTNEFEIYENCTITAKSIKENVESQITTYEIDNIDKIKPALNMFESDNITTSGFDVNIKAIDNESGLYQIKVYLNDELKETYSYITGLNDEKSETYTFENLQEDTTYKIKIELVDKVGNVILSEEKEVTTLRRIIVARIIGRNNSLYESVDNYELFESLSEAINACSNNQCTIQMTLNVNESVEILNEQNITFDLNGKMVEGTRNYTISNYGKLIIIDSNENPGKIVNKNENAIINQSSGLLGLGINDGIVSKEVPNITGTTYGIYNTGTFNFYDGKIEGLSAIYGDINDTPYSYNASITNTTHEIATLNQIADPEARIIGGAYYSQLKSAVSQTENGNYEEVDNNTSLMQSAVPTSGIGAIYDEETGKLVMKAMSSTNLQSSYIKIDLSNYKDNQRLTINIDKTGFNNAYLTIKDTKSVPSYNDASGRFMYLEYSKNAYQSDYSTHLQAGKIYYLHIGYYGQSTSNSDTFVINNITLTNYTSESVNIKDTLKKEGDYGFIYDESTDSYISTNSGVSNSTSISYFKVDLLDKSENINIVMNAQISSESHDYGYIVLKKCDINNNCSESQRYRNSGKSSNEVTIQLEAGKINYIYLKYQKDSGTDSNDDKFTISFVTDVKDLLINQNQFHETTNKTDKNKVVVLNSKVDTLQLLKNVTVTEPIDVVETREMILDLNGNTLDSNTSDYVIKNSGTLTIVDNKYNSDIESAEENYKTTQAKYDDEYAKALEKYNKNKEEYEKKLEEYYAKNKVIEYGYTGDYQEYIVPESGRYKIELWGASGGNSMANGSIGAQGGLGGYTKGEINLEKGQKLYIFVGQKGTDALVGKDSEASYNGGGLGTWDNHDDEAAGAGGGATDIRLFQENGMWSNFDSLKSRIMVAGGGGGASWTTNGGNAGGLNSYSSNPSASEATQTSGYKFGIGQNGSGTGDGDGVAGAGSGYYGGTTSGNSSGKETGTGGSSFISGYDGCNAIGEESTEDSIVHTGQSIHYSGLAFTNFVMKSGNDEMPTTDGASSMIGNLGNGYAKITRLEVLETGEEIEKPVNPNIDETPEMAISNFTYQGNGKMTVNNNLLNSYVNNQNNKSVTYYNKKITVKDEDQISVKGNIYLYQNYSSSNYSLGTAYIGFSKTNEANIDDFDSFVEKDINSYISNAQMDDFSITIDEPGEYYFKIVLFHNTNISRYTVYSDLCNLNITNKPELKHAIKQDVTLTGNITSTTSSLIYNDNNANLNISSGILKTNKSGDYSAIINYGNVSTGIDSYIDVNQSGNYGIKNYGNGSLNDIKGLISLSNSSTGIYNMSSIKKLSNITIDTKDNTGLGLYNESHSDIELENLDIKATNLIYNKYANMTITSGAYSSTGNYNNEAIRNEHGIININGGVLSGNIKNNDESIIIINSGEISGDNLVTNYNSTTTINGGIINNRISNTGLTTINGGTINNQIVNDREDSAVVNINESAVINVSNNEAIRNVSGTININGGIINHNSSNHAVIYVFSGSVNIGNKDSLVESGPKITSNGNGISFYDNNRVKIVNFYSGEITAKKGMILSNAIINEVREGYDINIESYNSDEELEILTLKAPTDYVAQVGETKYASLQSAIDSINDANDSTITILKDITTVLPINNTKSVEIDLNGHNIRNYGNNTYLTNEGILTIRNSSETDSSIKTQKRTILNDSSIKLNNITIGSLLEGPILNHNSFTLDSGYLTYYGSLDSIKVIESIKNNDEVNPKITINGGTIDTTSQSGDGIYAQDTIVNMNNGLITESRKYYQRGIYISSNSKLYMNSGEISGRFYPGAIVNDGYAEILNNSHVYRNYDQSQPAIDNRGNLVINGKDVIIESKTAGVAIKNNSEAISNIYSGSILTQRDSAIENYGTLNVGTKGDLDSDGNMIVSKSDPEIKGNTYGVNNQSGGFNFYDGIIKGKTNAIYGSVVEIERGYDIVTDMFDGYEAKYLDKFPMVAIKSTNKEYYDLQDAINEVSITGDTITMLRDASNIQSNESIIIPNDKDIILDLNGKTITVSNELYLVNNGKLTITDSNGNNTGIITSKLSKLIENNGELTIENTKLNSDSNIIIDNKNILNLNDSILTSGSNIVYNYTDSNLYINGSTLTSTSTSLYNEEGAYVKIDGSSTNVQGRDSVAIDNNGDLVIDDGTVDGKTGNLAVKVGQTGTFTLNGGTIISSSKYEYASVTNYGISIINNGNIASGKIYNYNDLTINGGTVSGVTNEKNFVMNGGTLSNYSPYAKPLTNSNAGTSTIIGGEITGDTYDGYTVKNDGILTLGIKGDIAEDNSLNVSTISPSITNTNITNNSSIGINNKGTFNFYDGRITAHVAISGNITEIESGYEVITETDENNREVKYLSLLPLVINARTNKEYYSLQTAIDESNNGDTLKITRNITNISTDSIVNIQRGKNITIDLNGKTITSSIEYYLMNNGELTLTDNTNLGMIYSSNQKIILNNNILNINGGVYKSDYNIVLENSESAKMILTGGTITGTNNNDSTKISNLGYIKINGENVLITSRRSPAISNNGTMDIYSGTISQLDEKNDIINNSGTLTLYGGNITGTSGYSVVNSGTFEMKENASIGNIKNNNIAIMDSSKINYIYNMKSLTINSSNISNINNSNGEAVISNSEIYKLSNSSGNVQVNNSTITGEVSNYNFSSSLLLNNCITSNLSNTGNTIVIGGSITSNTKEAINNSGILILGEKDGNIISDSPNVTGTTYGIVNTGTFNFYDGIINGNIDNGAINGLITEIEDGYKLVTNTDNNIISATLLPKGEDASVARIGSVNYKTLQDAINYAINQSGTTDIILTADIVLDSDIVIDNNVKINIYLENHTITGGTVIGDGVNILDSSSSEGLLSSIINAIMGEKTIIQKNIVIYQMDDGGNIYANNTYKLYKNIGEEYKLISFEKTDSLGIYNNGNEISELYTANNKLILNNLSNGSYKLKDDSGRNLIFTITDEGKIIGNVREYKSSEEFKIISTAFAELIFTVQTGSSISLYPVLIILIILLLILAFIAQKQRKKLKL